MDWGRIGLGVATGGLSESVRAGKYLNDKAKNYLGYGNLNGPPGADQGSAQDPNVAFQARQNYQTGQDFLGRLGRSDQEHEAALRGQNVLSNQLDNTINNPNASSVAQTQNVMMNDANSRQQLGAAAGVQGPNAFAARRQALMAIGQGNNATNQNAALLRAQETANAQQQKGNLLGQMSTGADRRYGQDIQAAGHFADTGLRGQMAQQGMDRETDEKNQGNTRAWGGKLLSGAGMLLGM